MTSSEYSISALGCVFTSEAGRDVVTLLLSNYGVTATENQPEFPLILRSRGERKSPEGVLFLSQKANIVSARRFFLTDNVLVDGVDVAHSECNRRGELGNKSAYLK